MNYSTTPSALEICADDYYVEKSNWELYDKVGNYIWATNAFDESSWTEPYTKSIFSANIVLDVLPKIQQTDENRVSYNSIKGSALFYRAFTFLHLAQAFCKPYSESANTDLGIILRLTSSVGPPSIRSTVQETYDQIISDFKAAAELLPSKKPFSYQPTKKAVYGALARTYLWMRDYANASHFSNLFLNEDSILLDFNNLTYATTSTPFYEANNPEIAFFNTAFPHGLVQQTVGIIDTTLYKSYETDDLRKTVYFRFRSGQWRFKGSYAGEAGAPFQVFDGIATDEMYLIRAECYARSGNIQAAMTDLNTLLRNRWVTGKFQDLTATTPEEAKTIILTERRKELVFRGLRWSDLRRFNQEGANITLTRSIEGVIYSLPPNDLRWVLLIPPDEINLSAIQQNPR